MKVQINALNKTFSIFNEYRNQWETSNWFESGVDNEAGDAQTDDDLTLEDAIILAEDREWDYEVVGK